MQLLKIVLACAWFACGAACAQDASSARLIADYNSAYRALGMAQLALPYQDNMAALLKETDVAFQRSLFEQFGRRLKALDVQAASACQQLDLKRIGFEIGINQDKLALVERFKALGAQAVLGDQGLYAMPMGREWYLYWLKRWLTSDVTPDQLSAFGEAELDAVLARYRRLQEKMGYAGRDQEFYTFLSGPQFLYPRGQTPRADYEAKQAIVFRNLDKLFLPNAIAPALIRESGRGAAFPADGYYDGGTFYFNQAKAGYGRRNLDMLMLHESVPGHHYQSNYARVSDACVEGAPYVFYSAFAEGWGAYVEEFGAQLGLYQQPADELGAVEWDLVRSIRVVLDVGINYRGWSRAQAFDYWHAKLPMLPELAEREITRVRNWPAQAITYKYGADVFRKLRAAEQARLGTAFDIRVFHDQMLRNGAVPLALLQ
ncbi:MAG: DUF885 domain-containing protein [Pseudomonadota bacterium]